MKNVISALTPDVLVVNETPRAPLLWRWQCARLASDWGLRRAVGGRDAGRNMICVSDRVRVRVLATSTRLLPQPFLAPRRGIVTAQCQVDGVQFGVVGVHLSLSGPARAAEAAEAVAATEALRGPVMICGDVNEPSGSPAWRALKRAGFTDFGNDADPTFSTTSPAKRIDVVLVRGAAVKSYGVPDIPIERLRAASDHCPVQTVVDLPDKVRSPPESTKRWRRGRSR